jgi:hypothetical protein
LPFAGAIVCAAAAWPLSFLLVISLVFLSPIKPSVDQRPSLTFHPGFGKWEKLSGRSQPANGTGLILNEFDR